MHGHMFSLSKRDPKEFFYYVIDMSINIDGVYAF